MNSDQRESPLGLATMRDVADRADVSIATVSRALRGLPNVAPTTKARITAAAVDLKYRPDPNASRLASGRTRTVAVAAPHFDRWYAGRIVRGLETALSDADHDLLVVSVAEPRSRRRFVDRLVAISRRVDALVLVDLFPSASELEALGATGLPIVTVGEQIPFAHSITIDNAAGAERAVCHLIGLGHERIALLSGTDPGGRSGGDRVAALRRSGYERAHDVAGLRVDPALDVDGRFDPHVACDVVRCLFEDAKAPTAIFAMSDEMAFGALRALGDIGLRVPHDVSIVGFDDHELSWTAGLDSIAQPLEAMGRRAAVHLLAELVDGAPMRGDIEVEVSLVLRSSSAPPPL